MIILMTWFNGLHVQNVWNISCSAVKQGSWVKINERIQLKFPASECSPSQSDNQPFDIREFKPCFANTIWRVVNPPGNYCTDYYYCVSVPHNCSGISTSYFTLPVIVCICLSCAKAIRHGLIGAYVDPLNPKPLYKPAPRWGKKHFYKVRGNGTFSPEEPLGAPITKLLRVTSLKCINNYGFFWSTNLSKHKVTVVPNF